jgi:pimeloyl-ACP methyl ester carboxylesterase
VLATVLNSLLFFPARKILATPAEAGVAFVDVAIETSDGEQLHGWWVPTSSRSANAHVLLCHGNAGNVGDRVMHAALLSAAGLDVLLFDYRGFGRSTGRPSELGTYRDARAARSALVSRGDVDPDHVVYVGESIGGAVALELALEHPPAGLVLMSTFTSVRDMARRHYPLVPAAMVPDAYPSLSRVPDLRAALLVIHGDRDEIVPLLYGEELFEAAPEPKRLRVIEGVGHNDLVTFAGEEWAAAIADFSMAAR